MLNNKVEINTAVMLVQSLTIDRGKYLNTYTKQNTVKKYLLTR